MSTSPVTRLETTPTGINILFCDECKTQHPVGRSHCVECGRPSLFIASAGFCLDCLGVTA